ncbi:hypothetical protein Plhal710r2_c007g0031601 [Plasmopara halstedii]
MHQFLALLTIITRSVVAEDYPLPVSNLVNNKSQYPAQDLAHIRVNTSLTRGFPIKRSTTDEEKMLDLRGVEKGAQSIASGSLSKMLEAWKKIVKVGKWKDHPAQWDTGMIEDNSIQRSEGTLNRLQGRKKDKVLRNKNALSTFGGSLKLSDHARGPDGVNAPFNSKHYLNLEQQKLIEKAWNWNKMKHDLTASITPQNQYRFLKRCWLNGVSPHIIEMVLKDKDGLLDDQHLEMVVQYIVQYNKAVYAGLLHAVSYQLYFDTSEIIMFVTLSPVLDLELPQPQPLIPDDGWAAEFGSVPDMTPDGFIEKLMQLKHGKPTDNSFILTYMPKYVWYCENTVASRDGLDKYGMKALKALYSSSHLVDDVIPTLLNGNAQSKATDSLLVS